MVENGQLRLTLLKQFSKHFQINNNPHHLHLCLGTILYLFTTTILISEWHSQKTYASTIISTRYVAKYTKRSVHCTLSHNTYQGPFSTKFTRPSFKRVRPHFDYCDSVYDGHIAIRDASRLDTLQNRAARLVTGTLFRTPTEHSRSRSSVGRALDSVWWQHTSRFQKFGVRGATGARCLSSILAGMVAVGGRP